MNTLLWLLPALGVFLWAFTRFYLRGADLGRFDAPGDLVRGEPQRPSAEHGEVVALLNQLFADSIPERSPRKRLAILRQRIDERGREVPVDGFDVRPTDAGGVPAEWVLAAGSDPDRRLLYIHGGAFTMGSPVSHRAITTRLAVDTGSAVLAIDYRLVPEHRRLDCLEDCCIAYRWIVDNGPSGRAPVRSLFVAGDSAGGNLTLATIAWARDAGLRRADAAVALSPATDSTLSSPSLLENLDSDHMLRPLFGKLAKVPRSLILWLTWLQSRVRPCDPRVSPAHGDLHDLPPLLVHASEAEMLVDDARRYVAKARSQGTAARLETWHDMVHVWHIFRGLPEADQAFDHIAAFLDETVPRRATERERA